MTDEELEKLAAEHNGEIKRLTRTHKGKKHHFGVFRRVSYEEAAEHEDEDPILMHRAIAELCLLWPSPEEWREQLKKRPMLADNAFQAIAAVSGEQFTIKADFDECRVEAFDGDKLVLAAGSIALAEYQRFAKDASKSSLSAGRTAVINTATFPQSRQDVIAFVDRYPFVIDHFLREVFEVSGAGVDIQGK